MYSLKLYKQFEEIKVYLIDFRAYFDVDFNCIIYHIDFAKMELFFTTDINLNQSEAEFDAFESRHILKAMRKSETESIHFTDGKGRLFQGRISITKPILKVHCNIIDQLPWPPPFLSILGIGFIRHSRLDYLIEKATELGINKFYFYRSYFTNYFTKNSSRWEKITRQAIKQSNRLYLPEINISSDYREFIKSVSGIKHKFLADQKALKSFLEVLTSFEKKSDEDIIFIIGPEGGLQQEEINIARNLDFLPVSFGEKRLRTETAAISAASYMNLIRN
jgi:16S rRNA (uracil1498-N3)-methyltransferase